MPNSYPIYGPDEQSRKVLLPDDFVEDPVAETTPEGTDMGIAGDMSNILQGGGPPPDPDPEDPETGDPQTYVPGDYTIDEVKDWVVEHDSTHTVVSIVLAKEKAGKNRVTLVAWLEELLD